MAPRGYTDAELDAAITKLEDPERLRDASALVTQAAPGLARVLEAALTEGGWYGSAHEQALGSAASQSDPDARLAAVRTLVAEQTQLGMLVGVAVGFELARELTGAAGLDNATTDPDNATEET